MTRKVRFNIGPKKSASFHRLTIAILNTALLLFSDFQIQPKVEYVIERAKAHLTTDTSHTSSITIGEYLRWRKPENNSIKLNFDAAWNSTTKHGYLDWLIRDNTGRFIAGGAKRGGSYDSAKEAEAEAEADALREGLDYAKENGSKDLLCEGDAKGVMNQLRRRRPEVIIWDCLDLVQICNILAFTWAPRTSNTTAHQIAVWATHKLNTKL